MHTRLLSFGCVHWHLFFLFGITPHIKSSSTLPVFLNTFLLPPIPLNAHMIGGYPLFRRYLTTTQLTGFIHTLGSCDPDNDRPDAVTNKVIFSDPISLGVVQNIIPYMDNPAYPAKRKCGRPCNPISDHIVEILQELEISGTRWLCADKGI